MFRIFGVWGLRVNEGLGCRVSGITSGIPRVRATEFGGLLE